MLSTSMSYQLIAKDMTKSLAKTAAEPAVKRETAYYLANIGKVKTVDDLLNNPRLYNYAMKAYGLEDMAYAKAFMRKVLEGGVSDSKSFANSLSDSRYKAFAAAFNFADDGASATSADSAQQGAAGLYVRQTLEDETGDQNVGARLALYFQRKAPTIKDAYSILADKALLQVVQTALGISTLSAKADIDVQAKSISAKLNVADFQDPKKLQAFIARFTAMYDMQNPAGSTIDPSSPAILFSQPVESGISSDLLLTLAKLKLGGKLMQSQLYVSLSAQVALQKRLDTIANNVANMNSVGFRAQEVSFEALLSQKGDTDVAFASTGDSFTSRRTGDLVKTDNPLDVAVQGDGWLAVQTPTGTIYTRDGRMRMTETGALQTLGGYPVLDAGSTPIILDPSGGPPQIAQDGMITQNNQQIGALGLFRIDDAAKLSRFENSGVKPDRPATPILDFNDNGVAQGFVENSNVNPVMEMTKLIMVSRAFDSVSSANDASESSLQDAIKTLGGTT